MILVSFEDFRDELVTYEYRLGIRAAVGPSFERKSSHDEDDWPASFFPRNRVAFVRVTNAPRGAESGAKYMSVRKPTVGRSTTIKLYGASLRCRSRIHRHADEAWPGAQPH